MNTTVYVKTSMHMQTTSGLRSAGKASSLKHDWSGMHRVDRTLSPLQPLDAGLLGVCVCVFDCVNAPLRLPEFICLVSYSTTPFSNFYSSCYGITSLLSSPVLRSFPLSVTQSNTDEAPHLINLQHELRGVLWMLRMIIHMLEKVHSPAHMLNSAVVTDVAQTHTWSMSSYPLSWRPCAFFK